MYLASIPRKAGSALAAYVISHVRYLERRRRRLAVERFKSDLTQFNIDGPLYAVF